MFEMLGVSVSTVLGGLGALATLVSVIVQMLKDVLPEKFPTKLLTLIVAVIVCILFVFIFYEASLKAFVLSVFMGFITAYTSMNGFDTLKDIWDRFQFTDKNDSGGDK